MLNFPNHFPQNVPVGLQSWMLNLMHFTRDTVPVSCESFTSQIHAVALTLNYSSRQQLNTFFQVSDIQYFNTEMFSSQLVYTSAVETACSCS